MTTRSGQYLFAFLLFASSEAALPQITAGTAQSVTIKKLETRIESLESQIALVLARTPLKNAFLDCNSPGFTEFSFETSYLIYLASCAKIEPYLEGHKVTIEIGNPYTVTLSNISGTLGYGKNIMDTLRQSVPVSTTESIAAGSWTRLTVIVNPSTPEDLRAISLSLKASTVFLAKPKI
jgi:hypothetical protein